MGSYGKSKEILHGVPRMRKSGLLCMTLALLFTLATFIDQYCSISYSKTSNNGPSEKRTTSVQRTAHLPPIDFTIELIHYEPPRSGHLSTPNNGH